MYVVTSYATAVVFCLITMLCWGSWANTQKLASRTWRYELYYWDYVIGMVVTALLIGLTMGSLGTSGRAMLPDLAQAAGRNIFSVLLGGVIFNASNILLSASVSLAGMAVAFPLGVGLALVLGTIVNYVGAPKGDPTILFIGVALIVVAIICNGVASARADRSDSGKGGMGIALALVAGVLMSFFYRFVARAMDLDNFESPTAGMLTPYSAVFVFSIGVFISNLLFNTLLMRRPLTGDPVSYRDFWAGGLRSHIPGLLGGLIWCIGTAFSYIAAEQAGAAVSYALGQGAPMIAAIWGVFVWREFRGSRGTSGLLWAMFAFYIAGLALIVIAGN